MRLSTQNRRSGKALAWLIAGLLIGGVAGAGAVYVLKRGKAGIEGGPRLGKADELSMVPADAVAFVHLRARDTWKAEEMADLRKVIDKAGPEALKLLDEGFIPAPSTLDRATLIVLAGPSGRAAAPAGKGFPGQPPPSTPPQPITLPENPLVVAMISFTAAFDAGQVKNAYLPNSSSKNENGKEFFVDDVKGIGLYFPNDRVIVVGMAAGVSEFVKKQSADGKSGSGPLARPLTLASEGGRHLVGAVNLQHFKVNPGALTSDLRGAPPEIIQLAKDAVPILKAEAFAFALGIAGEDTRLDIRGYYKSDKDAEEAEAGIRSAAELGRKKLGEMKKKLETALKGPDGQKKPRPLEQLPEALLSYVGLGGVNSLDELLANPPLKRDGSEVVLSADKATMINAVYSAYATFFGILFDSVANVRTAAARMQGSNNLKQIGLAMHNHHDATGALPSQGGAVAKGKEGLSWRVHILPFIEQEPLYLQFKLDEPWDSANNKKLIDKMPQVYVSPLAPAPAGQTYYKVFSGKDATFFPGSKTRLTEITDGTSNTIMTVEGGQPVIWTKPDDIPFDGKIDPKTLALPGRTGINIGMGDGSVRWVELSQLTPAKLAAMITRHGGEVIGWDDEPQEFNFRPVPGNIVPFPPPGKGDFFPKPGAPGLPPPKPKGKPD